MQGVAFLENIDMLVLAGIVSAVALAFVLVVIIFTVKFRAQQEHIANLSEALGEKEERACLMEESLNEVRILNSTQLKELGKDAQKRETLNEEIQRLTMAAEKSQNRIEILQKEIAKLKKSNSVQQVQIEEKEKEIFTLEEEVRNTTRRNEFWVEQMTEVRTKYDALKLKVK